MFATQRLYLTADKARLVPEGDADAATLYASLGDEIPDSAAERFGLVDGALPEAGAKPKGKASRKAAETKEAAAGDDKGAAPDDAGADPAPMTPGAE